MKTKTPEDAATLARVKVLNERLGKLGVTHETEAVPERDRSRWGKLYTGRIRIRTRDANHGHRAFFVKHDVDVATYDLSPVLELVNETRAARKASWDRQQARNAAFAAEREFLAALPESDRRLLGATGQGFELKVAGLTVDQATRCLVALKEILAP